jgi:quercetin dioxygenase-like cupin family protein
VWTRPYLPRVCSATLPETPAEALVAGLRPGTRLRVLSRDADDGAATCLWRIPPGWSHPDDFALAGGEALYVLQGEFSIGDQRYAPGHYSYRPAGRTHEAIRSHSGALVYAMWDGAPELLLPGSVPIGPEAPILWLDGNAMDESPTPVEGPVAGIMVRILRRDPVTGGMTLIIRIPPGWEEPRSEHHDCVEESFKLSGEIWLRENGEPQTLVAGDYFFRPPRIKHGPMRTGPGTSSLIRFSGTVVNHYGPLT